MFELQLSIKAMSKPIVVFDGNVIELRSPAFPLAPLQGLPPAGTAFAMAVPGSDAQLRRA